jgi:dTDP-4-amino-4,6-dideoxygalactose transaminase
MTEAALTRKIAEGRSPVPFVDLGPVSREIKDSLLADIAELIDTGRFVNGPHVEKFEREFAASCGRTACVGVASGLDALRLALLAYGLKRGDEVLVPAMTFVATFEAVAQAGGRPVVVDVREDDVGIDPEAAAAACTERTRFLLPVHLYGQMADVRALRALAAQEDLVVVEDACQAHGAERDGIRAGAAGDAGAFSFYPSKNLGAFGDAGALVLDDESLAAVVRALREHGESSKYESVRIGYTARLDAIQALVLLRKLPLLERWNADRRNAADFYTEALEGVGDLRLPTTVDGSTHVWHVYAVRTSDPASLSAFLAERRIATARHYPQVPHLSRAFEHLGLQAGSFPVAEAVARETLSLPLFSGITEEQLEAVVEAVSEYFARG